MYFKKFREWSNKVIPKKICEPQKIWLKFRLSNIWKNGYISLHHFKYYFQIYYFICLKVHGLLYLSVKSTWICIWVCFWDSRSENQWHCKTDVYWRKENKLLGGLLLESTIPAPSCSQLTFLNFSLSSSNLKKTFQIEGVAFNCNIVKECSNFC